MRCREIGLGIQADKPLADYRAIATLAEECGIDVLSVFADLWFQPPVVALLEMARVTERVRLGPACWNPFTSHPYELAGQLAALHELSGGRAYLGLARGSWLADLDLTQPRPITHLREAAEVVRHLLSGSETGYAGRVFHLAPGRRLRYTVEPAESIPLLIGAWGPQGAALAGEIADELKIGGTANPAMIPVMRERLAVGSRQASRPEDAVRIVVGAVTVVDKDRAAARRCASREVAMYLPVVAGLDPTVQLPEGLLDRLAPLVAAGDHEAAGRLVPSDVLDLFSFSGTPEDVAAQAQKLFDAGAARVEFGTPHGLTNLRGVMLIGHEVLPLLDR